MGFIDVIYWLIAPTPIWNLQIILFGQIMLVLIVIVFVLGKAWMRDKFNDYLIMFDNSMRWDMYMLKLGNRENINIDGKAYPLSSKSMYLSNKGKALVIKFWNRPDDFVITPDEIKWVHSDTLDSMIKNEDLKKISHKQDKTIELLIKIGAICSVVALLVGIFVAAKVFGIIKN